MSILPRDPPARSRDPPARSRDPPPYYKYPNENKNKKSSNVLNKILIKQVKIIEKQEDIEARLKILEFGLFEDNKNDEKKEIKKIPTIFDNYSPKYGDIINPTIDENDFNLFVNHFYGIYLGKKYISYFSYFPGHNYNSSYKNKLEKYYDLNHYVDDFASCIVLSYLTFKGIFWSALLKEGKAKYNCENSSNKSRKNLQYYKYLPGNKPIIFYQFKKNVNELTFEGKDFSKGNRYVFNLNKIQQGKNIINNFGKFIEVNSYVPWC
jgi:hypothetical protein